MEESNREYPQIQDGRDTYKLVFAKTPVSKPTIHEVEVGISIGEALHHIAKDHIDKIAYSVNSEQIFDLNYKPLKDDNVAATIVPGDPISGSFVLTYLLMTAVTLGATYLGYKLFMPSVDEPSINEPNRLASIRGIGNKARKYEPFRAVMGKRLIAPDYIAEPYTETRGEEEWFKLLLAVGYGPLQLRNFKIGETPLEDYEHNIAYIDHYENTNEDSVRALWPSTVIEEQPGIDLEGPSSAYQTETSSSVIGYPKTSENAPDKIEISFLHPAGLVRDGDRMYSISIEHSYTLPITTQVNSSEFGSKTISSGTLIKVVKLSATNVDSDLFGNDAYLRPQANTIIKMKDGSYRVPTSLGKSTGDDNSPWDKTRGYGINRVESIMRRSYTFPTSAIVVREGNLLHIDTSRLTGQDRKAWRTNLDYDPDDPESGNLYEEVSFGTWDANDALGAYARHGDSSRQLRGSVRYTPLHKFGATAAQRDYAGTVSTTTKKMFPEETPDDAALNSKVILSKFKTIRSQTEEQFQKILGYEKPYLRYEGGPAQGVRNFRPVIIALEVKATEQLSGMLKNFNVEATGVVPSDWNADWRDWPSLSLQTSENPADYYRWLLQGPLQDAPMANDRVNLESILEWRDLCAEAPPENTYDTANQWRISYEMVGESTLLKEMQKVAFTGRAEFSFDDSKYGVVVKDRKQYPVQIFSPKNSWAFTSSRVYPEVVDGIRFEFDNEDKEYQQDQATFLDPLVPESSTTGKYNATTIEGVPDSDMAFRLARLSYYETFLQRERYKFNTDVEGLVARRGSLVRLQHDIIDIGKGSGRVTEIGSDYLKIDEDIDMQTLTFYFDNTNLTFDNTAITLEGPLGATFGLQFRFSDGEVPENPVEGVYRGLGRYDVASGDLVGLQVGDFLIYGDLGKETQDCLVVGINYGDELTCEISMVNYSDEVFNIDENPGVNPIPNFVSNLADRVELKPPRPPSLSSPDDEAGINIVKQQLYLSLDYNIQLQAPVDSFYLQVRSVSTEESDYLEDLSVNYDDQMGWEYAGVVPYGESLFILQGVERGIAYRIRARSRSRNDLYSAYNTPVNVIVPLDFPPPPVTAESLAFEHRNEGTIVSWDRINDPDRDYFEVRTDTDVGNTVGLLVRSNDVEANIGYINTATTVYVFPRTVYGVYAETSPSLAITTPATDVIDTGAIIGSEKDLSISLSWVLPFTNSDQYSIDYVTVKRSSPSASVDFASADLIDETLSTNLTLIDQARGTNTFWFQIVYRGGLTGSAVSVEVDVPFYIPGNVVARAQVDGANGTRIRWQALETTPDFDVKDLARYEVRSSPLTIDSLGVPDALPDAELISTTTETSLLVDYLKAGTEPTYYVYGVSRFAYYSLLALVLEPTAPDVNTAENIVTVPIDNTVVIDWVEPTAIIYPVASYEVWELKPGRVVYDKIGNFSATYANISQREGGQYSYKVITVDAGGNKSSTVADADAYSVRVFDPTDFTLAFFNDTDFGAEGTYQYGKQGLLDGSSVGYFPVRSSSPGSSSFDDTDITFDSTTMNFEEAGNNKTLQDRIDEAAAASGTTAGTVTIQDKIDNVGPWIPQYTAESGEFESYYQNVYDMFDGDAATDLFLVNNTVSVDTTTNLLETSVDVDVRVFLEFSEDNSTWTAQQEVSQVFITDPFRYIRVTVYFDIDGDTTGEALIRLESLILQVDVKKRTEQGLSQVLGADATAGGTSADGNTGGTFIAFPEALDPTTGLTRSVFLDVDSVAATVDFSGQNVSLDNLMVQTRFVDTPRPDGFYAYVVNTVSGAFVDAKISWIARGI